MDWVFFFGAVANAWGDVTGDAAIALLKAGAETDKKDVDGFLALEVAPGADVSCSILLLTDSVCWVLMCDNRSGNTSSGRPRRRGLSCRVRRSNESGAAGPK